uniref:FBA_2 domain-containing protein n=1 Tax=Caenorhabditis tropicalis TaxID=1561998 RepID=A0A1I7U1D3_9PELO
MFPLFQLPLLCIQEVSDQWELVDLYNFSLLSKRAKRVSERKKKRIPWLVGLDFDYRTIEFMRSHVDVDFQLIFKQNRFIVGLRENASLDTDISLFLQATQQFLDVFKCRFYEISLELKPPLTDDQLIVLIDWMNGMKNEIRMILIRSATWPMFELFMNRFRKSIGKLMLLENKYDCGDIVFKRLNFEIKHSFSSNPCPWFHLDFLFSMDTEKISAYKINFSAEDLNVFLRSWQEGKTNQRMREFACVPLKELNVKEVLKGCGAELMDPRTTKQKYSMSGYLDCWIYGGIHIRRNDGRLAVIDTNDSNTTVDDGTTEGHIEDYLEEREIWNSDDSTDKWYETKYQVYII